MKFIALDVNVGDSFILKADDKSYIIDGGQSERGIVSKIKNNNINNIHALICTHYDADHFNGIIGIIKSRSYHINEIWLPDIFGDIALTLSSNINLIFELLNNNNLFNNISENISISNFHGKERIDHPEISNQNSYEWSRPTECVK